MLSKSEKVMLYELGKANLEGVILRNDLIDWLCVLQNGNVINGNATIADCIKILEPLELKIAKDKKQFETLRKYYTSKCEMPDVNYKVKKLTQQKQNENRITDEQLIELYNKYSISGISNVTGMGKSTVYERLRRSGISLREQSRRKDVTAADIYSLRAEGKKMKEILKILNISYRTYYTKLNAEVM